MNILVLDIGKTNKKCFVFNEDYEIVFEKTTGLPESQDEDGFPCEDLNLLQHWVEDSVRDMMDDARFQISALNCTAYGASFVHLNSAGKALTPLYNYLKPLPPELLAAFLDQYGPAEKIALESASPMLGMLNSGLQLYWLKQHQPQLFNQISYSLHLPQYIASLMHGQFFSEITSIGCHTMLWNFQKMDYHDWVIAEGIRDKFPPMTANRGFGLHDSSSALVPYLACFEEPFVLISTGTWCISMNPFNDEPLTAQELEQDCLCYLTFDGKPVKSARFFGGNEHDSAVKRLASSYGLKEDFYKKTDLGNNTLTAEYAAFMRGFMQKQAISTRLAIGKTHVKRIFVDGGFSQNETYMRLLATEFPEMEIFAAEIAQATALGAALAIHTQWNHKAIPKNLIAIKKYEPT